jgi:type II secretory ATPase GspE/PulE/Tfp pilus assembly ATPase PilB-like protein
MMDLGVEGILLNGSLIGVLAQRLVRRLCPDCRQEVEPKAWVRDSLPDLPAGAVFEAKGCGKCGAGFRGRTAIHQLLEVEDPLRAVIARNGSLDELRQQAAASGTPTLRAAGLALACQGLTTIEEVLRVCPT